MSLELERLVPASIASSELLGLAVRASTPCSMLVIDHDALRSVLESAPHLVEHISRVIAERQAAGSEADASALGAKAGAEERSSLLLGAFAGSSLCR